MISLRVLHAVRRGVGLLALALCLHACLDGGGNRVLPSPDGQYAPESADDALAPEESLADVGADSRDGGASDTLPFGDLPSPEATDASPEFSLAAVVPARGLTAGGEAVTVEGSGFVEGLEIFFGAKRAPSVVILDPDRALVYTPPHLPGSVEVRALRGDGAEALLPAGFLFHNTVEITSVQPAWGRREGGEPLTVRGRGFVEGTALFVGGRAALSPAVLDDGTLVARTPPGATGVVDVLVANAVGHAALPDAFRYVEQPELHAVAPSLVPTAGESLVRLIGAGFTADALVYVAEQPAPLEALLGPGEARVRVPAHAPGPVDVRLTTPLGSALLVGGLVYADGPPAPRLTSVAPSQGPLGGGNDVWLATAGLTVTAAEVRFGSHKAHVVEADDSGGWLRVQPQAVAAPALVDVAVEGPEGRAALTGAYAWEAAPHLHAVSPGWGPVAGGAVVELALEGLAGPVSEVRFGSELSAEVVVQADGAVTAVAPPGVPGKVDVRARAGQDEVVLAAAFEYRGAFAALVLAPDEGSRAGGTLLHVLGSGFAGDQPLRVAVGARDCTHVEVVDDGLLTARTPPNDAGVYDVQVTREEAIVTLPGAFTVFDPGSAYGGTWGGDVHGDVNVTVLNGADGTPLADAFVILGTDPATPYQGFTDLLGQITFSGPDVRGEQMVSASKECFSSSSIVHYDAANALLFLLPTCGAAGGGGGVSPGIVSGRVVGVDKMIVVPPGRCSTKSFGDGTCAPCADEGGCAPGWACADVGSDGRYCLPPCLATSDCPPTFDCVSMVGGALHCLPKRGAREVRCSTSWPTVFDWIGGQQLDPGPGAVADADGSYRINTRLGQLAVVCAGGVVDADWGTFEPLVIGAHRHLDPLPGIEISGIDVTLSTRLEGTLTVRLEQPPEGVPGPEMNLIFAFLDLGSDGLWSDSLDADAYTFDAAPVELTGLPRQFSDELYDASFTLLGAAISFTDNATPQSSVLVPGVTGASDDAVVRFDGPSAEVEGSGISRSLNQAFGFASDQVLAVGAGGLIARFDGQGWGVQYAPTHATLNDVWGAAPDDLRAVGEGGTLLRFDGTAWSQVAVPTTSSLRTVARAPDGTWVAAGDWVLLQDDGTGWHADPAYTWGYWNDAASDGERLWLVGDYGRILAREGGAWIDQGAPWVRWNGVWAPSPGEAFAVGEAGSILHFDGVSWGPMDSGTTADLYAVSGSGSDDVVAVGDAGTVLRYDGVAWTRVDLGAAAQSLRGVALFPDRRGLAVGLHEVVIGPFVSVPRVVSPPDGGVLDELRLEWTADEAGLDVQGTYVVISVPTPFGPMPIWDLMVDPGVTTVPLPDFPAIEGTPGLSTGSYLLRILRLHRPGMTVDSYDLFDLDPTGWRAWSLLETGFTR